MVCHSELVSESKPIFKTQESRTYLRLNKMFEEECAVLKEEVPRAIFIDKWSKSHDNYFAFSHEYKIDNQYYCNNYIAYKDYYMKISFKSNIKENLPELKETVDELLKRNLSENIILEKNEEVCYSCKSPLFF